MKIVNIAHVFWCLYLLGLLYQINAALNLAALIDSHRHYQD